MQDTLVTPLFDHLFPLFARIQSPSWISQARTEWREATALQTILFAVLFVNAQQYQDE